jgi:TRAP transporter TAXI family solute receptor
MNKRRLAFAIPLLVLLAALVVIWGFAEPAAPKEIELFAGPKGTTYHAYARRYADYLGKKDITINIVETGGSLDNLRRIAKEEGPAAGFAMSGVDRDLLPQEHAEELESLGSLSYEPFWLFVREESEITRINQLAGKRVSLGPPDSDVRSIAKALVVANGIEDQIVEAPVQRQDSQEIADGLTTGKLDAAFFLGAPKSSVITGLLESDAVEPVALERVKTYARLSPDLAEVVLPEGAFDLERNIPGADLHLIAPADNLVVRADLHPAVVDLLLDAARSIHREPTLFSSRGTFPNMDHTSLPLSPAAIHFYEEGPSPLRKYLPYWLASLISRFALIVAQVGAVVWILLKTPPTLLRLRFSMRQMRLYRQMEKLETRLEKGADPAKLLADLREIERQSAAIHPPIAVLSQYLELRQNIHDQRERIESQRDWQAEETTGA